MRYGYFDEEANEYVVDRVDVPVSWTNYLGVSDFCSVLSHHGGGYSYYRSPQQGRITRFRQNGVPLDRPGKYVYLRDAADGDVWSVSWQPIGKPLDSGTWRAAHGMGYTRYEASYRGIDAVQTVFVPLEDNTEVWDLHLTNAGDAPRRITVTGYVEFSFNNIEIDNQNLQMSLYSQGADYADGVIECDAFYEPWTHHFFASAGRGLPSSYDALRDAFIGPYRDDSNPVGVTSGALSGSEGTTQNHCGALSHEIDLAPGETVRLRYLLGYGSRAEAGQALKAKYDDDAAADAELAALRAHWRAKQAKQAVRTPHAGLNTMINTWTLLQAEVCVIWSRFASFVEVGGRTGLGYRDTAQDAMSVLHSNPDKCRQRIVELLHAQSRDGFGVHLFNPADFDPDAEPLPDFNTPTVVPRDTSSLIHGLEDVCSDDHLWLVSTICEYVRETGDLEFLEARFPFAEVATGSPEAVGTVWEHLEAALDFSAQHVGPSGVAQGLRADWNDCLNLGGGETSFVTFLHAWALQNYLALARATGHTSHLARYEAELARIADVTNDLLWDGAWWKRGVTRDGVTIGSEANKEGKIFLEHQAWPTIAGIASQERGEATMDSVRSLLGSEYGNHLNWPAFTEIDDTVGFLTRVYPGIKENASIFSHPNAWPIIAEAMLGRGDQAMAFYDAILPLNQNDNIEVRHAEPYAYVQFIYGRDHADFGLAQNPWLTGTAGWMYTAVTKYILGIRPNVDGLLIDPCIPATWDGFEVSREFRGATYEIAVRNNGVCRGVTSLLVDGVSHPAGRPIPVASEGSTVRVEVTLG